MKPTATQLDLLPDNSKAREITVVCHGRDQVNATVAEIQAKGAQLLRIEAVGASGWRFRYRTAPPTIKTRQ